jgi:hypothetical protein
MPAKSGVSHGTGSERLRLSAFWCKLEIEDGLITFEADTAGDFETSFRNAVDE